MRRRRTKGGISRTGTVVVAVLAVLASATAAISVLQLPAEAHGANPSIDNSVGGMVPRQDGITFSIVDSVAPELSATNTTPRPLEVLDRFGDPYLRIGPRGAEGNLNSAEFYRSADPSGAARVPARAQKPGAEPAWVQLSTDPSWAWFDARVRPDIDTAPADVVAGHRRTTLAVWSIPLQYNGRHARLDGQVVYAPPVGGAAARLTSDLHPAPGLTTALQTGRYPDLFVQNTGPEPLLVLGQAGEPFARIDVTGVAVNVRSPVHVADTIARGRTPEAAPNASAAPIWRHVSDQASYDWLDPRTRYPGSRPPTSVLLAGSRTVLQSWSVPVVLGSRQLRLDGVVEWVPAPDARAVLASEGVFPSEASGDSGLAWAVVGGCALLAAVAGTWWWRRRFLR